MFTDRIITKYLKPLVIFPPTLDFAARKGYNGIVAKNSQEGTAMNEHETITAPEQPTQNEQEIANMDAVDYMALLMECRIIQAS